MAYPQFVGRDAAVRDVLELVALVAPTDATVLITGETGTGKELIARALHDLGSRSHKPFIPVNCGALADTLLESELFGYVRGAFTGAADNRPGKFEAADGGTIFLDEIADMGPSLQVHLLRVLQTGEYVPLGSAFPRHTHVRVIAATNQPLKPLVAAGVVRQDLYYRLNVICLDLPPLRARRDDIPEMVTHFISRFAAVAKRIPPAISAAAERILLAYDYPGNVRELENAIQRAVILCGQGPIEPRHLPRDMTDTQEPSPTETPRGFHQARARAVDDFERDYLMMLLKECGGIVSRAAARCGLSERNFHAKLKKFGLRGRDFRMPASRPI